MADLSKHQRSALHDKVFGLPDKRAYPMPDSNHARAAIIDSASALKAGTITAAERKQIVDKADKVLADGAKS